jgi:hypothetical protein
MEITQEHPSKVEAAISFMQINGGSATTENLRDVLDLRKNQYPAAWLGHAVKSGRIHKTENGFALGPAIGTAEAPKDAVEIDADDCGTVSHVGFACAVWNDGDVSLIRDGETLATLSESEASTLLKFLRKTSGEV